MAVHQFLTIGEFASAVGLSISAVRFYADRELLTPAHVDEPVVFRSATDGTYTSFLMPVKVESPEP